MNVRKWHLWIGLLCALFLSACDVPVADRYSDFLADNDILMRLEVCFDDVEHHRDSFYTIGELETVLEDLETGLDIEDDQAAEATELFRECTQMLIDYLHDQDRPQGDYDEARAHFAAAIEMADTVRGA